MTEISIVENSRTLEIAIKHCTSSFIGPLQNLCLHSDIVRVSVALAVASQL